MKVTGLFYNIQLTHLDHVLFFCKTIHVLRNLTTILQALYKESFITKKYIQKLNLYKFKYGHPMTISNKIQQLFSEIRCSDRKT
jgi:hypothetical protein